MYHVVNYSYVSTISGMNQHVGKSVAFDNTNKSSSYLEYPSGQPFINDDYKVPESKRFKAFPESNRQAVMSALRGLQEKFRQLELDRAHAETNLRTYTATHTNGGDTRQVNGCAGDSEVTRDTDSESSSVVSATVRDANVSAHARDIHDKLTAAENRCELLERQLSCMRRMVQHGATRECRVDSGMAETTAARSQQNKISELERVHLRLSATQAIAENKIRELENELKQEKHCRHMMQQQQSTQEARQMLMQSIESQPRKATKKTKKKRTVAATKTSGKLSMAQRRPVSAHKVDGVAAKWNRADPMEHYHLNLAGIPFIAGKSTTPSHSLAANFQEVLSLMKCHNTRLCQTPHPQPVSMARKQPQRRHGASGASSTSDLDQLLLQLEDEFGRLSFEHLELKRQQQETCDLGMRDDLEREHDRLLSAMEVKASQIAQLQRHREAQLRKKKTKKQPSSTEDSEDTVTMTTSGQATTASGGTAGRGRASLNLLKDLKKIQTTLRKDDLSWDE